jgi:magnesium chelatase subunit D
VLAQRAAGRERAAMPTLVLVSDGRANVALADGDPFADALTQARALRAAGVGAVVVDTEEGPVRLGRARTLARELGAQYVRLADLAATATPDTTLAAALRDDQPRRRRP